MKQNQLARENMVDSQIHPLGVVSEAVLQGFMNVPREWFVPESKQACAYLDEDLEVAPGRFLLEPQVQARLLQSLNLNGQEAVLDIGCATGYSAAVLSYVCSTVIAVETEQAMLAEAQNNWESCDVLTIIPYLGDLNKGCPDHKLYDAIIMNGSVAQVPRTILSQLEVGGKLVTVVRPSPKQAGKATLFQRDEENVFSERVLFDAFSPYLPGLEPKNEFIF